MNAESKILGMLRIEITPSQAELTVRSGITNTGKPYTIQEQHAYVYLGGDYPMPFLIPIPEGRGAFAPGQYVLGLKSITIGRFSKLEFSREFELIPFEPKNLDAKK